MNTEDKDELVAIVKLPMVFAGVWPRKLTNNALLSKLYRIYAIFLGIDYTVFYLLLVGETLRLIVQHYSISTIITSFSIVVTATKISGLMIITYKNKVIDLLEEITRKEDQIRMKKYDDIKKLFLGTVKVGKIFRDLLSLATALTVGSYHVAGYRGEKQLIKYNQEHNASIESHFMYQFWFNGINRLDHLAFVNTFSFVTSFSALVYYIVTTLIIVMFLVSSAAYLSILQHRLRNYIPDDLQEEQMEETIKVLIELVFEHRYIIGFTEHINKCCKNIIMMEFVLTSIDVATGIITTKTLDTNLGWSLFYLIMNTFQIFCLAWTANEVMIQSQAVGDAAYESKWYLLNKKGKMLTQILMQRAHHRPLIITIGWFGPMTLQTFLMVMKASYTYVSVMK